MVLEIIVVDLIGTKRTVAICPFVKHKTSGRGLVALMVYRERDGPALEYFYHSAWEISASVEYHADAFWIFGCE